MNEKKILITQKKILLRSKILSFNQSSRDPTFTKVLFIRQLKGVLETLQIDL